jgi:hypothetical protein
MSQFVDMQHSPHITEDEVRRRLAACYDLLLQLAEDQDDAASSVSESACDHPDEPSRSNPQESPCSIAGSSIDEGLPASEGVDGQAVTEEMLSEH